jgi:CheY-like chemotaxis protein
LALIVTFFGLEAGGHSGCSTGGVNNPPDTDTLKPADNCRGAATSELNNLLQIISGTSVLLEGCGENKEDSEKYLTILRTSIERAERLAAGLAERAGGTNQKVAVPQASSSFVKPKQPSGSVRKPSIVLVDDEEMALTVVKRILSDAGFEVTTALSGFECLNAIRQRPHAYDLILLDLTMPFMDGEETFRRVLEIRADVPVILCTGFIEQDRLNRLMTGGLSGFMRKPIAPDEMIAFIRSTLASLKYSTGQVNQHSIPIAI